MLNQSPIILNCFSRGGSNILWNMFLTHPDVCSPIWETLQIFSLNPVAFRWEGVEAVIRSRQLHLFDQWQLQPRKPLPKNAQRFIDKTLYTWKLKTFDDSDMKFKYEDQVYTLEEVQNSRLVIKNNNGLTFLSDIFLEMYPGASYVGLVRHPLALYESHVRRKTPVSGSVEKFCGYYEKLSNKMLHDANQFPNYHIIRFEDLLADPIGSMQTLYRWTGLEFNEIKKARFKAKPHYHANGEHRTGYNVGQHYWFDFENVYDILEPKVNVFQEENLADGEKQQLLALTYDARMAFGYDA